MLVEMIKKSNNSTQEINDLAPLVLARLSLTVITALIIFASLTPFNFHLFTLNPFAWIAAPLPKYIPLFDVEVNVLGYLPLGFLTVFALFPRWVKWPAFIFSLLFGIILSASLESAQTYLSTRVANLTDLYANALGTFIGALLAITIHPVWLSEQLTTRFRITLKGKNQGIFLLLAIFPIAQIFPQNVWLGMGDFNLAFLRISPYWSTLLNNTTQEVIIAALAVISTSAFLMCGTSMQFPKIKVVFSIIFVGGVLKIAMSQLQYGSFDIKHWISIANLAGVIIGFIGAIVIRNCSRVTQWVVALVGFILLLILVNILPQNPYYLSQLQLLPQGRLTHFNGLLESITMIWPLLAIFLLTKQYKSFHDSFSASSGVEVKQI
ncbi:VanZ family protein [Polynucleobacter kasalickyi]|uniref:VanZ like family protein n=1 Tax=Polynucleobacter kasalickyi TaxID=1938817 RepID=A0A1W2AST4_9BURK|nr:VanZ family protein [Polynucleobacter kasalickyi]SMC63763.1 VanZ like family protein [Polynucleobacter kasalickyi]